MKSYTDLEQSKKLATILPLESADMLFQLGEDKYADSIRVPLTKKHWEQMMPDIKPCWSLAALLSILRGTNISTPDLLNKIRYSCWNAYDIVYADNPVDACYEMILKLHELKAL